MQHLLAGGIGSEVVESTVAPTATPVVTIATPASNLVTPISPIVPVVSGWPMWAWVIIGIVVLAVVAFLVYKIFFNKKK